MHQNVQYELHKLEKLLVANGSAVPAPGQAACNLTPKPAAVRKEMARIRQSLIEKTFTFKDEALVGRYIRLHHKGLVALMDEIFSKRGSAPSAGHYEDLEDLLSFLETNFEEYADGETKVPDNCIKVFKSEVAGNLPVLERIFCELPAHREIIGLFLCPLKKLCAAESHAPVTYRKLRYLRQLRKQLLRVAHEHRGRSSTGDEFRRLMYHMNYNRKKTFAFLTGFITAETDKCETAGEKIERLSTREFSPRHTVIGCSTDGIRSKCPAEMST